MRAVSEQQQQSQGQGAKEKTLVFSADPLVLYEAWLRRARATFLHPSRFAKTGHFFAVLPIACFLLTLAAFWPILRDLLFGYVNTNCDAEVGLVSNRPWYHAGFAWICGVSFAVLFGYWAMGLRDGRRRQTRTWVLVGALLYCALLTLINNRIESGQRVLGALASQNIFELQWMNLQHLQVIDCPSPFFDTYALRKELRQLDFSSFADFHREVMADYQRREEPLRQSSAVAAEASDAKLKTLFILNFVSGLWNFGNKIETGKPGCVLCNERNNWKSTAPSMRAYLESRIGCCTDYAFMVKLLLDEEKIDNRLTTIPGHVFNEVCLGGRWCILDATANIFLEKSWEDLYQMKPNEPLKVYVFPHGNMSGNNARKYRPLAGQFRLLTLLRTVNHPESLREVSHPAVSNSLIKSH